MRVQRSPVVSKEEELSSSDSEVPLAVKLKRKSATPSSKGSPPKKKSRPLDASAVNGSSVKKQENCVTSKPKIATSMVGTDGIVRTDSIKNEKMDNDVKIEPISPSKSSTKKGNSSNGRGRKSAVVEEPVWQWWKESTPTDGRKWKFFEHVGPMFTPPYEPLESNVRFYYDGKPVKLSLGAEEVATFYAKMLDHEFTKKEAFNANYFKDWRTYMTHEEKHLITSFDKCDFTEMSEHFKALTEARKNRTKEEKEKIKLENQEIQNKFGFCMLDGYKQKIGNFRMEPPGLFRGRGNHPKMGMVKRRVLPEDVIINCSKDSVFPKPPSGHQWKEIRHDPTVSWLACWTENIQGNFKYVMLNASSKLKGEKDWCKYETARRLHKYVDKIRMDYTNDFKHKEMRVRQRAVALYFIDKLALRAGNDKDDDEADTVGCCSLRVEHIKLHEDLGGDRKCVVEFDFLGKDSIRYQNSVSVAKRVFKNLKLFLKNKQEGDDLFDRLSTTTLNTYLRELMDGLTAKVFRTYNASKTLEEQLEHLTKEEMDMHEKMLAYNRANRAVAVLCNHQRAVPKTFEKSMENLKGKIEAKKEQIHAAKKEAKQIKDDYSRQKDPKKKAAYEKKKKQVLSYKSHLARLELQVTDKSENKEIALGTSKLNYLDPRISIAWCKKWNVPVEKVYNKTQREKFQWAVDMTTKSFVFRDIESDKSTNRFSNGGASGDEEEEEEEEGLE